jgi:2-methylcitrate dehydratase PrpD
MNDTSKDTICMQLSALTSAIASTQLSTEIIEETRLCFLDFLASTLAAPMTPAVSEMAVLFGSGHAKLLHNSAPTSVAGAAFVHGYLSTVEDIDDAHALASGMHLSATVFPAALAIAQSKGTTQGGFIRAAIAGYEVAGRLARSMDQGLRARGFHASGALGPFATCAAASIMLDLDRQQMAHAFASAASGAGGLFAFLPTGADSRHLHAANASVAGLVATMAAKNGNIGPLTAFEGPDGFIGSYSETCDMAFISRPPPDDGDYEMLNAYHKRFTACGHAIPTITLALELRKRDCVPIEQIKSVEISGYPASAKLTNFPADSVSKAKFSLPIVFALAYIYGDVSPAEMNMSVINQPKVQSLARKVLVGQKAEHSAVFPGIRSGSVLIRLANGQSLTLCTTTPIGMQGNRLSFLDIAHKFHVLALPVLGDERCKQASEAVSKLMDSGAEFNLI